jgi:hypothetical protein
MLVRSTISTDSMPIVLTMYFCKTILLHVSRAGSYVALSCYFMGTCQEIQSKGLPPTAHTSTASSQIREERMRNQGRTKWECLIQLETLLYMLSPRLADHVPIASDDTKTFLSHIAILNKKT